ncbi:stalk domain-containing protein [Paenibacillus borealis]|uniref:Copper amine oxidase-like N-terminal domain-containing protein n=1 Tax=Paenibacillus borealis TaxID=160799 RepID=A0A089L7Z3_PAEBO|nr:stalk domain-containing protein [Paenibacillus borealis]AIQ56210.1 hypothetical protein PBOR_04000 [Paenibacillus borealis]
MRFKRIIALLLVFAMVIPTGLIHAADLVLKEDLNIMKYTPAGLRDLEETIDVTDESYEAEIIVTFEYGEASYPPDYVQLSIAEENPVGKRIVGNTLFVDQGAPAGTITIKAVLPGNYYTTHTITVNSGGGTPQPAQPRITHTLMDTSDLNHLIISATALDDGIHKLQIRTFYKNASGMVGGDISNLTQEGNSSVFSADITEQVSSKMRDSNAYEMTYFFTMLDENGGFLQYPEVIDMNSLEGALTVKLAEAPDNGSGEPELDKADLIAKINEAKDLYSFSVIGNDIGEYPGEVMDAFNTAIEAASRAKDTATTQTQIDAAYQDLMGSITSFKADAIKGASRSDLMDKYGEAIILYRQTSIGEGVGQYPLEALYALEAAVMSVDYVLNNPTSTQEDFDNAYQSLSYAIKVYRAAQIKAGDTALLQIKINEAWDLFIESKVGDEPGQFSEQAYLAFLDVISLAEEAIYSPRTQKKIDEAYIALSNGMQEFLAAKIPEPDKTELLQAKINEAQLLWDNADVGTNVGQYPAEAKDALETAIYAANEGLNASSTEAELDAAYQALNAAITTFKNAEIKRGDTTALGVKIHDAWYLTISSEEGNGSGQYPSSAFDDLRNAISAAEQWVINSGTEAEIEEAYEVLVNAIQSFLNAENTGPNKDALQAAIETAKAFLNNNVVGTKVGQYPENSKNILQDSIDAAWETLINLMSTQVEVDQALTSVNKALADFKASVLVQGDQLFLHVTIIDAKELLDNSPVGEGAGQFPSDAMHALEAAIGVAETAISGPMTQVELDEARQALETAVTTFKAAEIKAVDKTALQGKIDDATSAYNMSRVGTDFGEYPAEAKTALKAAIDAAKVLIDKTAASQAEIDAATQTLTAAITTFYAAAVEMGDYLKLQEKVIEARSLYRESPRGDGIGAYPDAAFIDLDEAIELANEIATYLASQTKLDKALQALSDAMEKFEESVVKAGDNTALQAAITEAKILLEGSKEGSAVGEYPLEAMDLLQSAITDAENLANEEATQAAMDEAILTLNNAVAAFEAAVIKEGNSTELQLKIEAARNLLSFSAEGDRPGEYPSEAFDALDRAIADAETLIDIPGTQQEIDEAYHDLVQAIEAFEKAKIQEGDYIPLLAAIAEATTLYNTSPEGHGAGQYWPEVKALFMTAIEAANVVAGGPSTQEEIEEALQRLADAVEDFQKSEVRAGDSTNLQSVITELNTLLGNSKEGDDAGEYPAGSKAILQAAVTAVSNVISEPATQQEIDQAYEELVDAADIFIAKKIPAGNNSKALEKIHEVGSLMEASKAGTGVGQYPAEAIAALEAAFDAAVIVVDKPSSQVKLDATYQALVDAVDVFKKAQIQAGDSEDADAVVSSAETLLRDSVVGEGVGEYPLTAKTTLEAAIAAAKEVFENPATQAQIDTAKAALEAAITAFEAAVNKEGSSEEADAVVTGAETLLRDSIVGEGLGEYPLAAKTTLEAAIAAAKEVFEQPATQAQIDTAKAALEAAISTFEAAVNKEGGSEEADAVLSSAETLLRDSVVGEGVGEYPLTAKTTLEAAISAAKEVFENPAKQAQIDTAKAALEAAITAFEAAVNKEGGSEEADAVVSSAETLLSDSVVGEGVGQYPSEAVDVLKAAIKAAKEVLEQPATQAQIDEAKAALEAAITTFEAAVNKEGSSEEANAVVSSAETLLRDSIVGEGLGEYPLAAKTALEAAIAAAKKVLEQPATQAQIDEAKATLEAAISTFEAAVNKEGSSEEADAVVTEAEALLVDVPVGEGVGQYPLEAVDVLKAAIKAAKEVFEHPATQAQIDEAKATLEAAITAFEAAVNKEGDSEEAGAVVTEAEALLVDIPVGEGVGQYPSEAVDVLKAAIKAAKEVFEHPATQAQIDEAKATLEAAISTFEAAVNKEGDSEEAGAVVTEAEALLVDVPVGEGVGQYPSEAVDVLKAAIKAAKEVLDHPATQAQIDTAKVTLEAAITAFEAAVNKEGDSEEAGATVNEAQTLLKDSVVGEGVGQYPAEAVKALEAAIAAAKEVFEHPATQAQIDAAKATLEAAVAAFEAAVIKAGNAGEIQAQITEATTLLNESTEGNGVGQYPAGSKAILQAAITAAENVIRTAATQAEIDKAIEQLTAAYNTFRAAVIKTAPVDSYTPPVNSYTPPATTQPVVVQPSTKITDGLNTVETGQGTVKTAASEVQAIMKAAKPVILESTLGVIDFGKNGLNVPELKLGLGASLELGILMTEKSKTDEALAGAKLDQAGLQPLGGKVLDLIAQLNYSNGTSTRIKSFAEPVKVTINLKELGLTGDTTNLTAVRFVPQADGTYKTIKLGGVYIPATNSFEFYTDSFSLYSIVKADSVTKITFKVDSKEYSIGTLVKQNDVPPVIQEQRTLVPIRAVAEALGAEVKWDHATKTATITLDGKVLTMTLGELIEGMDVPAQAIDGRIMVPLRYVSEALGAYVMWFPQDKRIEVIR